MATYLDLCRIAAREVGLPNWNISDVNNNTDHEINKIIGWVAAADLDVLARWEDWNFLWSQWASGTITAGNNVIANVPTDAGHWHIDCFTLDYGTQHNIPLSWNYWDNYRSDVASGIVAGVPGCIVQNPGGALLVDTMPTENHTVYGEYTSLPTPLATSPQVSQVPHNYHRVVVARAKIYYGEAHDDASVIAGSTAEHTDLLEALESRYRDADAGRRGTIREQERNRAGGGVMWVE